MDGSTELLVAIGIGAWFVVTGIAATIKVFRDYSEKGNS